MNQLNLGYGNEPEFKRRSMENNPRFSPEKAAEFRQALETEKEASRVLREMKRDQAIEKAREFVKEGKSAFSSSGGGGGSTATKVISNFYTITKHQIELLPVSYYTLISKN